MPSDRSDGENCCKRRDVENGKVSKQRSDDSGNQVHIAMRRDNQEGTVFGEGIQGIHHFNGNQNRERKSGSDGLSFIEIFTRIFFKEGIVAELIMNQEKSECDYHQCHHHCHHHHFTYSKVLPVHTLAMMH